MDSTPRTTVVDQSLDWLGRRIAGKLARPSRGYQPFTFSDPAVLRCTLRPADVLLVEGNQRLSSAIKYLTQSTWSHAALFIGDAAGRPADGGEPRCLIEANLEEGVVAVPLSKYARFNTRICRPVGLTIDDSRKVIDVMTAKLGAKYDTRHIFDLARYLLPAPPVPIRWRRRMIAFGAGDPTRTICSALIAQAFEEVHYPILPRIELIPVHPPALAHYSKQELLHIRDYRLFVPRDFDVSPYFQIVKPTIESGFDYRRLIWVASADGALPFGRKGSATVQQSELCKGLDPNGNRLWTRKF